MVFSNLPESWVQFLGSESLRSIAKTLAQQPCIEPCYPTRDDWFKAFELCAPEHVRAVIVGQDPYHGPGQAMGLAFSVPSGQSHPPSLRNLLIEYHADTGYPVPRSGDLSAWAREGVLLMNRVLTVAPHAPGSHRGRGWEQFTDLVIARIAESLEHCVFCLWGRDAQQVRPHITVKHSVIVSPHPSPLSAHRGFFGSRPFSKVNRALEAHGQSPLNWALPSDLASDLEGHIAQLF